MLPARAYFFTATAGDDMNKGKFTSAGSKSDGTETPPQQPAKTTTGGQGQGQTQGRAMAPRAPVPTGPAPPAPKMPGMMPQMMQNPRGYPQQPPAKPVQHPPVTKPEEKE